MKLTIKYKQTVILALLLVLLLIMLVQGCGSENSSSNCTAPAGSKITINPSSQTIHPTAATGLNWTVTVAYPDGSLMPKACIGISGNFAVPNSTQAYQFQFFPKDVVPNLPVNSGFSAQTDDFGQYTFSTLISAGSVTFTDTITVQSGANIGTATLTVN